MVPRAHDEIYAAIASAAQEDERRARNQRRTASVNEYQQDVRRCVLGSRPRYVPIGMKPCLWGDKARVGCIFSCS